MREARTSARSRPRRDAGAGWSWVEYGRLRRCPRWTSVVEPPPSRLIALSRPSSTITPASSRHRKPAVDVRAPSVAGDRHQPLSETAERGARIPAHGDVGVELSPRRPRSPPGRRRRRTRSAPPATSSGPACSRSPAGRGRRGRPLEQAHDPVGRRRRCRAAARTARPPARARPAARRSRAPRAAGRDRGGRSRRRPPRRCPFAAHQTSKRSGSGKCTTRTRVDLLGCRTAYTVVTSPSARVCRQRWYSIPSLTA